MTLRFIPLNCSIWSANPRADSIWWDVRFSVSKGTYIRALARDVGAACETCAHVETLRRTRAGVLDVEDCLSLDALERYGVEAAIDPVFLLESRMAFLDDEAYADVCNGKPLRASELSVYEALHRFDADDCGRGDAPCLRRVRFTMASSCAWCMATI